LLKPHLSPGQASDHKYAPDLSAQAIAHSAQTVVCDKGYDNDMLRRQIEGAGLESLIPFQENRKNRLGIDLEKYRELNATERYIGKLKENRRVTARYGKKAAHFAGFLTLAAIKECLKIIC